MMVRATLSCGRRGEIVGGCWSWPVTPSTVLGCGTAGGSADLPAQPAGQRPTQHGVALVGLQAQVVSEEPDQVGVGPTQPGKVRAPEQPLGPEGVDQPA